MNAIDSRPERKHSGYQLARLASGLIAADTIFLLVLLGAVLAYSGFKTPALGHLLRDTPLPFAIYALWLIGVAGTAAAVLSIVLYGFRERWFWRWLLVASLAWLAFPPVHALMGLLGLVLLLRSRSMFPKHQQPEPRQA